MIAPTAIIRGVGITFGIKIFDVEGTTGYYDSNLNAKALKAAELLQSPDFDFDFGFVHVKATDDAGHDQSSKIKIEQFEKCDVMVRTFIDSIKEDTENEYIICVTGDHTTPTLSGDHTYEPVPVLLSLASNYLERNSHSKLQELRDSVEEFSEISCSEESLLGRF